MHSLGLHISRGFAGQHVIDPVSLHTARLVLRPWRAADVAPFAQLNADERVMEFFVEPLERDASNALAAELRRRIERDGYGLWAVEIPGQTAFAGFIGLNPVPPQLPFAPALEIGWRLAFAAWGQGFATEGARVALEFAHVQLGLAEVVSMTSACNVRSRRVMEKIGMIHTVADDFEHPRVPAGHRLRAHVLYRHRTSADGVEIGSPNR